MVLDPNEEKYTIRVELFGYTIELDKGKLKSKTVDSENKCQHD